MLFLKSKGYLYFCKKYYKNKMKQLTIHDRSFGISIPSEIIQSRVDTIAKMMNEEYAEDTPLFIVVLNGAFVFAADLFKRLTIECEISFVKVSSYRGTESTGIINELIGLSENIHCRKIIIVEDIVDSGNTIEKMINELTKLKPAELKIATLLFKPEAFKKNFKIDYVGFEIPNDFVVGYGLDYDGLGRNLPDIYKTI